MGDAFGHYHKISGKNGDNFGSKVPKIVTWEGWLGIVNDYKQLHKVT